MKYSDRHLAGPLSARPPDRVELNGAGFSRLRDRPQLRLRADKLPSPNHCARRDFLLVFKNLSHVCRQAQSQSKKRRCQSVLQFLLADTCPCFHSRCARRTRCGGRPVKNFFVCTPDRLWQEPSPGRVKSTDDVVSEWSRALRGTKSTQVSL